MRFNETLCGVESDEIAMAREAGLQKLQRGDRDRIRHLESELRRKEKALAEAAALLVLQKKARAVWGEEDA
jgi:transposase